MAEEQKDPLIELVRGEVGDISKNTKGEVTPECREKLVTKLAGISLYLVAERGETNGYAGLSVRGGDFVVEENPGAVPPPYAVVLRATESRLLPALNARKSLQAMLDEGILTVQLPDRFQAEHQLKAALRAWYKDWISRQKPIELPTSLPMPGWTPGGDKRMPRVTVIGAGIAGLTAAMELVERGFQVQLVEGYAGAEPPVAVAAGGIAASQRRRLPDMAKAMLSTRPPLVCAYSIPVEGLVPNKALAGHVAASEKTRGKNLELVARLAHARQQLLGGSGGKQASTVLSAATTWLSDCESQLHYLVPAAAEVLLTHELLQSLPPWVAPDLREKPPTEDPLLQQAVREIRVSGTETLPFWVEISTIATEYRRQELPAVHDAHAEERTDRGEAKRDLYLGIQCRRGYDPNSGRFTAGQAQNQALQVLKDLLAPPNRLVALACDWTIEPLNRRRRVDDATGTTLEFGHPGDPERVTKIVVTTPHLSSPEFSFLFTGKGDPDNAGVPILVEFEARAVPYAEAWRSSVPFKTAVDFRPMQRVVLAEHGYRLFPSFYRHLFDTMGRIPLYNNAGQETGETVLDNLVSPGMWQLADSKNQTGPIPFSRKRLRSFEELRNFLKNLARFGYQERDLVLFELRLLRYLTSCEARRNEAAEQSWATYLGLSDFSEDFRRTISDAPLSLLAMKAEEVDARTYLDVLVQLFLDQMADTDRADRVLNGPTSEAMMEPWLDYLRIQGTRIFQANLKSLSLQENRLVPIWEQDPTVEVFVNLKDGYQEPDYYVLAIPLERVWQVMQRSVAPGSSTQISWDQGGVFSEIWDWRTRVAAEAELQKQSWPDLERDQRVLPRDAQHRPFGPFRDMTGIQFYFRTRSRLGGGGHIYYLGAPWGLSTISQPQYWRVRRRGARDGYVSNLSVDVCNLYVPGPERNNSSLGSKNIGICSPPRKFSGEVWDQLLQAWPSFYRSHLLPPAWYHLDNNLRWIPDDPKDPHRSGAYENTTPYLINRPGEWALRPGQSQLEQESPEALLCQRAGLERIVWQDPGWNQWFVAGPHMKTYTRLTTMEAACESARHAVNRLLLHHAERLNPDDMRPAEDEELEFLVPRQGMPDKRGTTRSTRTAARVAPMPPPPPPRNDVIADKLLGDFVPTWTLLDHEPKDFAPLRRLDEELHRRNLPHMLDILKVEALIDRTEGGDPLTRLMKMWEAAGASLTGDPLLGGREEPLKWLKEAQQKIRSWLRESPSR